MALGGSSAPFALRFVHAALLIAKIRNDMKAKFLFRIC
jgi:hypothetical protein